MAFLTLNGVEIRCSAKGGASRKLRRVGTEGRSAAGAYASSTRARKREWEFETVPLGQVEATALRGLVAGVGVHFPCDGNANSDGGLTWASAAGLSYGGPGSLQNHGSFLLTDGGNGHAYWQLPKVNAWTILASAYLSKPGENHIWRRVIRRSDGAKWQRIQDGATITREDAFDLRTINYDAAAGLLFVRAKMFGGAIWQPATSYAVGAVVQGTPGTAGYANATFWAYECTVGGVSGAAPGPAWAGTTGGTNTDNTVTWRAIGERYGYAGDLAWVPYAIPDSWAQPIFEFHKAQPWSALPKIVAGGAAIPGGTASVVGEVTGAKQLQFTRDGVFEPAGEVVEFTLREV